MSDFLSILMPICALTVVCSGLLVVGVVLAVRFLGLRLPAWMGGVDKALGGDSRIDPQPASRRRHVDPKQQVSDLDFDAAVARYAGEKVEHDPEAPEFNPQRHDLDSSSPISGRRMRDGRYRRVTGGTPGREQDQDFRRVEADQEPINTDLPPTQGPIRKRRRRRGLSDDEVFGGMLDEDGDGDVDF